MSSPVTNGEMIFLHAKTERLTAMDANDGEILWTGRPMGKYQIFVQNNDIILAPVADGELLAIKPTRKNLEIVDRKKVADDAWA